MCAAMRTIGSRKLLPFSNGSNVRSIGSKNYLSETLGLLERHRLMRTMATHFALPNADVAALKPAYALRDQALRSCPATWAALFFLLLWLGDHRLHLRSTVAFLT
jgi:hypothetical protein